MNCQHHFDLGQSTPIIPLQGYPMTALPDTSLTPTSKNVHQEINYIPREQWIRPASQDGRSANP